MFKNSRRSRLTIVISIAFGWAALIVACASLTQVKKAPDVRLESVEVGAVDAEAMTLIFALRVENPNKVALEVDSVEYAIEVDHEPFASGALKERTSVPASGNALIKVPARARYRDALRSALAFLQTGSRSYRISGVARLGLFRVPFDKSGEVTFSGVK